MEEQVVTTPVSTPEPGISVDDLITRAYDDIVTTLSGRRIELPESTGWRKERGIRKEIADDSDHHRSRRGYSRYEELALVEVNGHRWLVARGVRAGSYPADFFVGDIAAIKAPPEIATDEALVAFVEKELGAYLHDSLLVGLSGGSVGLSKYGRYKECQPIEHLLHLLSTTLTVQNQKIDETCLLASTLQHPVTQSIRYAEESVAKASEMLRITLALG